MHAPRSAPKSSVATSSDGNIVSRPISVRDDLVDAPGGQEVVAFGPLRRDAGQPRAGAGVVLQECSLGPGEIADDRQRIAERFERLQDRPAARSRNRSTPASTGSGSRRAARRRTRAAWSARQPSAPWPSAPAPSSRAAAAPMVAPMPRRNVRRGNARFVTNIGLLSSIRASALLLRVQRLSAAAELELDAASSETAGS